MRFTSSQMPREQAYRVVAYLHSINSAGQIYLSFLIAPSHITLRKVHYIPRLEICGSLVVTQLAKLVEAR